MPTQGPSPERLVAENLRLARTLADRAAERRGLHPRRQERDELRSLALWTLYGAARDWRPGGRSFGRFLAVRFVRDLNDLRKYEGRECRTEPGRRVDPGTLEDYRQTPGRDEPRTFDDLTRPLDGHARAVLRMRYVDGLGVHEIADRLGTPFNAVRWQIRKALAALHATLEPPET